MVEFRHLFNGNVDTSSKSDRELLLRQADINEVVEEKWEAEEEKSLIVRIMMLNCNTIVIALTRST